MSSICSDNDVIIPRQPRHLQKLPLHASPTNLLLVSHNHDDTKTCSITALTTKTRFVSAWRSSLLRALSSASDSPHAPTA